MALSKKDNPENNNGTKASTNDEPAQSDADADEAKADVVDAGAGVPHTLHEAAERLPERDAVQKAYKRQMLADDVQTEVDAKVTIVDESPDAAETPSGAALKAVQGESDPVKQGEEYDRVKRAVRLGSVEDAS